MARYSETDAAYAQHVFEALLDADVPVFDLPEGVAVPDVELDASDFAVELELLESYRSDAPALIIDGHGPLPIALSLIVPPILGGGIVGPGLHAWRGTHGFDDWANRVMRALATAHDLPRGVELIRREEARAGFLRRGTAFLASRIAAVSDVRHGDWAGATLRLPLRAGQMVVAVPGCDFVVSTDTGGLRVLFSGAYRLTGNNFGHPTSPVSRVLQAGDYFFGVDGGPYGHDIQWDLNAIVTLPGPPSVHLNY